MGVEVVQMLWHAGMDPALTFAQWNRADEETPENSTYKHGKEYWWLTALISIKPWVGLILAISYVKLKMFTIFRSSVVLCDTNCQIWGFWLWLTFQDLSAAFEVGY